MANCILSNRINPYQIGDIFITTNSTNPAVRFGGTWTKIKDKFLLGAGDTYTAGTTGGEATHTLTIDEIPSHTHTYIRGGQAREWVDGVPRMTSSHSGSNNTDATGGGLAHNNMPPYLVVNMWQRTA